MAITLNGSTLEINSGLADGTALGGTLNTLIGTGFSSVWASRIILITGGTGEGQSRCVQISTSTTITVYEDWVTQPDSTTTFTISYDVTDLPALNRANYVGDSQGKVVRFQYGDIKVKSGGVFGGVKNTLMFFTDKASIRSEQGSFIQFGMVIDGFGREGGSIIQNNHGAGYVEMQLQGTTRFYGMDFINKMQGTEVGSNKLTRINHYWNPEEFIAYNCDFRDIVLMEDIRTDTRNCNFIGERSGLMTFSPPINSFGHKIFSGMLSARAERQLNGADLFDVSYFGDAPNDPFFNKPVFLFNFQAETYYWNVAFPDGYANAFKWHNNNGNGTIYEGYSVQPIVQDSSGLPIENALVTLADKDGNAGWTTGKDSNFEPVKTLTLTSDSNGTIINSIGTNESGLVLSNEWTRANTTVSSAVSYYPFTLYIKKYGLVPIKKSNLIYASRSVELLAVSENARLASTEVEAAGISGIALDFLAKSITITEDTNSQKLFDYYHYELSRAENSAKDDDVFVIDFINIGSWSLNIDGCTYTGDATTTGTINLTNDATFNGRIEDANGIILPITTLTVQVNQIGADVVILAAGTNTVLGSVDAQSGNDFVFEYTGEQLIDIGVIIPGYKPSYTYNYLLTGQNQSLPISLLIDRTYI